MVLKNKIGALCVLGVLGAVALSQYPGSRVSVSLHGVNYSDREFSYFIADPDNPEESIGGEHIGPFSGGGTTCCAILPSKWKPGTSIRLSTIHWLKKLPDGTLPEVSEEHKVEVPKYAEAGELWVIRNENGKISVVSSNVQPNHPNWPGAIKGWPVPSLEYRRERWEIYRDIEQGHVENYESLLRELEQDPKKRTKEAWEADSEYRASQLKPFVGPNDPLYREYLKKRYINGLQGSRIDLEKIMKARP